MVGDVGGGRNILVRDIARKLKSLDHFVYLWGHRGGFYLPPAKNLTWDFVAQILSGEKRLLETVEVGTPIQIPKAKGIKVQDIWEELKDNERISVFLPTITEGRAVPREYFLNVG